LLNKHGSDRCKADTGEARVNLFGLEFQNIFWQNYFFMEKLEVYSKIRPGDRIRVYEKLKGEEGRETIFEGILISKKHGTGVNATFCVREVIDGVGVEKIYPLHSPLVSKIELLKKGRGKRAKLYWIREKPEREIRKKLKV